ncbi:hypothetical protein [Hyphomonas sp.]|uniref:hypothetical protein n=1 Tax=Hyphomonas sp. TaxID=87 RepID=UPI0025BC5514|nr:hypothetical protein [Hyphomonas sp.]
MSWQEVRENIAEVVLLARAASGYFDKTLKSIVRQKVDRHFRTNRPLREHRYPAIRRAMGSVGTHPYVSIGAIAALYAIVSVWTWYAPLPGPTAPDKVRDYFRDFQSINMALLGVQASFIGLVFPLVIAFVGLLNQGRASFATRLTIYFDESGARLVGISSLLLCIVIALQLPLAGIIPVRVVAAGAILNLIWLALNIAVLGFFLFRTVAFVQPAQRDPITWSYVANVAWRYELHAQLIANNWGNAGTYGHLPAGDENGRASIYCSPLWDSDPVLASRDLRRDHVLDDVRFGVIRPVAFAWLKAAERPSNASDVSLAFPVSPGESYTDDTVLARSQEPLGWGGRTAIRLGFLFRKKSRFPTENADTSTVLKEMVTELLTLADLRKVEEFGSQLRTVKEFHAFLYLIAQATDHDFNFSELESTWTKSVGQQWASQYRDLQRRVTERLGDEPELFARCCYLPADIYAQCRDTVSPTALAPLLDVSANLFHHLMVWAVAAHRDEAGQTPGPGESFMLTRLGTNHAGAWRSLVAGRERLLDVILRWPKGETPTWTELRRHNVNSIRHLQLTAEMVGRSAWNGDRIAVLWSVDLLIGWIERAERDWPDQGHTWWALRPQALTLDLFSAEWPEIEALPITTTDARPTPRDVYAGIFHNAWRDYIIALATVCIHWCREFGVSGTAALAARMLLSGRRHDQGASSVREAEPPDTSSILIALLRIVGAGWRFDKSYASRFDHLAERLGELRQEPWVSMRIYSSSGGLGFSALYTEHALAMMAATDPANQLVVGDGLRRMLVDGDDVPKRRREEYLRALLTALADIDRVEWEPILGALLADPQSTGFETRLAAVRSLLEQSIQVLDSHRLQAIRDAEIDPERLLEVASAAGKLAFSAATGAFPIHVFSAVETVQEELTEFTLRSLNQEKGAFSKPQMAQPVSNEESWWSATMRDQVASIIWRDVLQATPFETLIGTSPEEFWSVVKNGANNIRGAGGEPILVISSSMEPRWLHEWRWAEFREGYKRPEDLTVHRENNEEPGYEFSLNDIRVYRAACYRGECYLLSRTMLEKVRFRDFGDGSQVKVDFESDASDPWRGSLTVKYQRAVQIGRTQSYRIRHAQLTEGPEEEV